MDKKHLLSDQDGPPGTGGSYGTYTDMNAGLNDGASAPPADMMPVLPGYESLGPNDIPPSDFGSPQPTAPLSAPERQFEIPAISEEVAQEAFINYVSSKCCYSTKPAREMQFTDLLPLNTYRYRLETFTESRKTEWDSQVIDGSGAPPPPWSIPVPAPSLFRDCRKSVRVPHTSSVKGCHLCLTLGRCPCRKCLNVGRTRCGGCSGTGLISSERRQQCGPCNGTGMVRCFSCRGVGSVTCKTCKGHGKLHCFIKLVVTWKNNISVSVIDKGSGFPMELLDKITGEKLFTDMAPMVYPVVNFPDKSVNVASKNSVTEHQSRFSTSSRILQQRQTIELIPITQVHYGWKEKIHYFFVYGNELKVYTNDYPAKCYCCSIIDQDEVYTVPTCPADVNKELESGASAPPRDLLPLYPEYEGFGPNVVPPSNFDLSQPEAPPRAGQRRFDIPAISEELAQEAFINFISSKCCYSSKPAREMEFTDLLPLNTYRYRLETFTESRTIEWDSEPYNGQVVERNGVAPPQWSIPVPVPSLFKDCEKSLRVPNTSTVKGCDSCLTLGRSACRDCVNSGRTRCGSCGGAGFTLSPERHPCNACRGSGIIKKNNIHVSVVDKGSGFPMDLLNQITGETLFTDMAPMVYPVVSFPDSAVNAASESAVREHQAQFYTTCRILQQRQIIELIPITRVHYTWKQKTHIYFVYGVEHKIHTKDYPAKCASEAECQGSGLPEEGPSAPPPGWLDRVSGYEENTGGECPPPPDFLPKPENDKNASVPNIMVPSVSEDLARDALLQFVGKKWTYSSKPAKNLIFKELKPFTVYRYRLETFTEARSSAWESEPHTGQSVDGPQNGASPLPWHINVSYPPKFTDGIQKVRVPHSSFVKSQPQVHNLSRKGKEKYLWKVSIFDRKKQIFEFIPDRVPEFPLKKFEKVSGEAFFVDENLLVYPVEGFPDQDICQASKDAIHNHLLKYSAVSRILQQRQTIELVPLTHVFYAYGGKDYEYFVFGRENKVHTTKYPTSCSIL
ncbi:hypothetical protein DNTS_012181 [Danionella cerebrum]|uniref:Protein SSUH2 homolog n=1 Tax=Danionella cerebrum TaxID=2873325 RepID=A0A553QV10_9TELE|nr:hypothetical protein DNTS_012181 [Danionella translucida]